MTLNSSANGLEVILGLIPSFIAYFAFNVPFWIALIQMVFGSEFILFAWTDDVLVFLITHWVSNATPLVHIISIWIYLLYFL